MVHNWHNLQTNANVVSWDYALQNLVSALQILEYAAVDSAPAAAHLHRIFCQHPCQSPCCCLPTLFCGAWACCSAVTECIPTPGLTLQNINI